MKVIFMGTPSFAVPILEEINQHHEVVMVVTQPDQLDRKKNIIPIPVKEFAIAHHLPVYQPADIKKDYQSLIDQSVDIIVTAAYGQFIPKKLLTHPKFLSINVHGSILPMYRGGAPIQRAIMNGDKKTGISILYMTPKMDAGDVLWTDEIAIEDSDNQTTMFKKLSRLGAKWIVPVLNGIENKTIVPIKQNEEQATYAYNIRREEEKLDFSLPATTLHNQIRGLYENPTAYFVLDDKIYKVFQSSCIQGETKAIPGTIVSITKDCFIVACGNQTLLAIHEIQQESKRRMSAKEFLNGAGRNILYQGKQI